MKLLAIPRGLENNKLNENIFDLIFERENQIVWQCQTWSDLDCLCMESTYVDGGKLRRFVKYVTLRYPSSCKQPQLNVFYVNVPGVLGT